MASASYPGYAEHMSNYAAAHRESFAGYGAERSHPGQMGPAFVGHPGAGYSYGHPGFQGAGYGHPGFQQGAGYGYGHSGFQGAAYGHPGFQQGAGYGYGHPGFGRRACFDELAQYRPQHVEHPPMGSNFVPREYKNPPLGAPTGGSTACKLELGAGGFDASKLSQEEFARYDTNGDGVLDMGEVAALQEDIKAGRFKLKKAVKGPSSYAYGDVKAELKAGGASLKKAEKAPSSYAYGDVKAELLATTPPKH